MCIYLVIKIAKPQSLKHSCIVQHLQLKNIADRPCIVV